MALLTDRVTSHQVVGLDTSVFIYHIEQESRLAVNAALIMREISDGRLSGVTSVLTLLEIAIKPLRLGRPEAADAYTAVIHNINNLQVASIDSGTSRIAAELRADYGLRTPDALHIAACLANGATAFVTNDRRLRRVNELAVIMLEHVSA